MKTPASLLLALALLATGAATAQTAAPAPQQPAPPQAAEPAPGKTDAGERRLNLKLEEGSRGSRIRFNPKDQAGEQGGLPALGGDARTIGGGRLPAGSTAPFPKDTMPNIP